MIRYIVNRINKKKDDDQETRKCYGIVSSLVGVAINILLFIFKLVVGLISGSIAIIADAINNLSDAASSIITFVSFKMSCKPADKEHPYGHARIEYAGSLFICMFIFMVGFQLIMSSIDKIMNPQKLELSIYVIIVLLGSILTKYYMYLYNGKYARIYNSSTMRATAQDSLNDIIATSALLISLGVSSIINFNLDGYIGLVVSLFIIKGGYDIVKDTLDELIGLAPSNDFIYKIKAKILSYEGILGIHDLMVHSYGANKYFASVHAEVSSKDDIMNTHELLDMIERDILEEFNVNLVIHMDPINTDDPLTNELRIKVSTLVRSYNNEFTTHDFRMVKGEYNSNLIFDIVIPFDISIDISDIDNFIISNLSNYNTKFHCVITIDRE